MSNEYAWGDRDTETIKHYAHFLEDRGYVYRKFLGNLYYEKDNVSISIHNKYCGESPDVIIKFIEQNRVFGLVWFINYFNDMNYDTPQNAVECIIELIKFFAEHYPEITTFEYCSTISRQIDEKLFARYPGLKNIVASN